MRKIIILSAFAIALLVPTNAMANDNMPVPCDYCVLNDLASQLGHALKEYLWCSWAGCS